MRIYFVISFTLIVLGVGNIAFGNIKRHEYKKILTQEMQKFHAYNNQKVKWQLFNIPSDVNKERQHLQRIRSRIDFYTIVIKGGQYFILISILVFIWPILVIKFFKSVVTYK